MKRATAQKEGDVKLYELTTAYRQASLILDETEWPDAVVLEMLDKIEGDLKSKATNIAMLVRNTEATAEAIREAEKVMAARRKAMENRAESIREYLLTNMVAAGITAIESEWFKLSVRDNPPSVVIDDVTSIPAEYMRQPETPPAAPDKKKLADDLKEGVVVPGAHLEQGKRLQIK